MGSRFSSHFKTLQRLTGKFNSESQNNLSECLLNLKRSRLPSGKELLNYHNSLLFLCAHAHSEKQLDIVENELARITSKLKKENSKSSILHNSGLPFTLFFSSYSHDCLKWLLSQSICSVQFSDQSDYSLNEILDHTLPSLERSNTTAGFNNQELLDSLKVKKSDLLSFYIKQFSVLNEQPTIKDYFFDKLSLEIKITAKNKFFSRTYNRIPVSTIFFHQDWCKQFDSVELLDRFLPKPTTLSDLHKVQIINCIKLAMTLNDRETDPATYLDPDSLRMYELERGLSVAIYGMEANRQLPIESYVGYTLFKNGFPTTYGGSWIFGERANFGINIFEFFRGGESGYAFCQLLRVYRKVFGISFFEVEPYQFGLDNSEGITSGAFWFYYRYGFRPMDKTLRTLALHESRKIKTSKSYKTKESILNKFTESNMVLKLGKTIPLSLRSVTEKITTMIQRQFKGDRSLAIAECTQLLKSQIEFSKPLNSEQLKVFQEVALVSRALRITHPESHVLLGMMIKTKSNDLYEYQQSLLRFIKSMEINN